MNYQSQYSNEFNPYQKAQSNQQVSPTEYVTPVASHPYPTYGMPVAPVAQPAQSNGQAVAGLVLGIISMIAWLLPVIGLPTSIVGLILSLRGKGKLSGRTMATVGVVLTSIALGLAIINAILGAAMAMH